MGVYDNLIGPVGNTGYNCFDLTKLSNQDGRYQKLPFCIKVILESLVRNCDNFSVLPEHVENVLDWERTKNKAELPFKPGRVLLQDLTGVPVIVDLAAMRDSFVALTGKSPELLQPLVPVQLVVDHSVVCDTYGDDTALSKNETIEMERNAERFAFLKWGQRSFQNVDIVPTGSGICHQVNLEYLSRLVFKKDGEKLLYPDSCVGTDSHTPMVDGLGVLAWGVGGIEAEAVMLGQPIAMLVPDVVCFKLTGKLNSICTATDLVLTITKMLRARNVVGKMVEFWGSGVGTLSVSDRATISNMSPEFGATCAYFPIDNATMKYLEVSGRNKDDLDLFKQYLQSQALYADYADESKYLVSTREEGLSLELSTVEPSVAGPKRPHDHVPLSTIKDDFNVCLNSPNGFKGFGIDPAQKDKSVRFKMASNNTEVELRHGSVVIAAITSCTNTSNPYVMLGAGMIAKKAVEAGLKVPPYVKTSLSPGSGVVELYLKNSGLYEPLKKLNFYLAGFGCMTCIGNSGDLDANISDAILKNDLVAAAVLSGNRNYEGRIHPLTRANYLMSPMLVVAFALVGNVSVDLTSEPIQTSPVTGKPVYLKDLWPSFDEMQELISKYVTPQLFKEVYAKIKEGNAQWDRLPSSGGLQFEWDGKSTYVRKPPFFEGMTREPPVVKDINGAYCLALLGDSITTDHISPAGKIALDSPASQYLQSQGLAPKDFNSYGSRRGNHEVMIRGTFANIRLVNKLASGVGPKTLHIPTNTEMFIYEAAMKYEQCVILAGKEYGSGSSRDWAAKGVMLQNVRAVIAQSFERIHRSNLVGMGVLPLEFQHDQSVESLGLTGKERYSIQLKGGDIGIHETVKVTTDSGREFYCKARIDSKPEIEYFKNGGILQYVLRLMVSAKN